MHLDKDSKKSLKLTTNHLKLFPNLKSKKNFLFSDAFVNVKSFSFSLNRKTKLVLTAQVPLEHCYEKITFTFCLKSLYRVKNVFQKKYFLFTNHYRQVTLASRL